MRLHLDLSMLGNAGAVANAERELDRRREEEATVDELARALAAHPSAHGRRDTSAA